MTKSQHSKKCIWLGAGTPNKLETHLWTEHIPAPGFSKCKLRKTFLCVHRQVTSQQPICLLLWKAVSSSSYQISNVIDLRGKKKKDNLQHYLWKFANLFCAKCFQHLPLLILATDTRWGWTPDLLLWSHCLKALSCKSSISIPQAVPLHLLHNVWDSLNSWDVYRDSIHKQSWSHQWKAYKYPGDFCQP